MIQELLYLNRCKNPSPNITNKIAKQLNTFFVLSMMMLFMALVPLKAQEKNDPNSEYYSPAANAILEIPVDSNSYVIPVKKSLKKGKLITTMADLSWDGGGDGVDWNDPNNWSPNQVPTSSDNVTIPNTASVQLIDGNDGVCNSVTIQNGGSLTIGSVILTASDSVSIQSGGALYNSGTINIAGNWRNSGNFFSNGSSLVRFNGSDQIIESSDFYYLHLEGSGTKTAVGNLNIEDDLRIRIGVSFDPDSYTISIGDDFENDGVLLLGTGTFNFSGTGWQSIYSNHSGSAPGVWAFNDIQVTGNSGGIGVYDTLSVQGDLTVESSEYVHLLHYNITTPSEGIINGNGGSLTFAANSYILVGSYVTDGFPTGFNTVTFATQDNSALCYYRAYGNYNQVVRTQEADGGQITYGRLRLEVNGTQSYTSTKTLDGNLDVDQYIYIDPESDLDVSTSNYDINVWGNWNNQGSFNSRNGTVTFDGGYQYIQGTQTTTFNNIVFAGTLGKILQQQASVKSNCTVSAGVTYFNLQTYSFNDNGSSTNLTINGNAILYIRGAFNFPIFDSYTFATTSTVRYDLNGFQTVNSGITYGNLYLGGGNAKQVNGVALTVAGNLTIANNTTLNLLSGFNLSLQGDYLNQGTLSASNSTVTLTGSNNVSFNSGGSGSGKALHNLTVNKPSGTVVLDNNLLLSGDFVLTSGDFGMQAYNRNIIVNGDWTTASGTEFLHGTGIVYFTGSSAQTITANGDGDFWNVDLSGGGLKSLAADVHINNNLTIQSDGNLDLNAGDMYLSGSFNNNNGGSFDADNQTFILDGTANANFYIGPNDSLWNLTVNKSSGAYVNYDEHDLKIGGNVTLQSGEFRRGYNSSTSQYTDMIVYGNWTNTGGKMLATVNDTVFFVGGNQNISGSGTDDFDEIVFGGTGTKTISGDVDANRSITIESGVTVSVSGTNTLKVGRDFINNGTFTANQSTLVFEEYAGWGSVYITTNGSPIYNLEVNLYNTNPELYLQDDLVVQNNIRIIRGALDVTSANNYAINCGGSWTIETEGRFNERNGTVTFNGSAASKSILSNGYNFYELVINSSGSRYALGDDLITSEDLVINSGSLTLNGNLLDLGNGTGDSLIINDSLIVDENAQLRMANGSQIAVQSGGDIVVSGSAGNLAKVTNQGSGTYAFDVLSGGAIAAGYYTFEYMDVDGVNIQDGSAINTTLNLSNGVFTNGASGGTLLTVDNNQTINNIQSVSFPSNPGGGASNVTKNLNQGLLAFVNPLGAFQGAAYENDANGLISWTYSSALFTWDGSTSTNWNEPTNWDLNSVPGASNRVTIPGAPSNQPTISSTADSCFSLTIESGATLTFSNAKLVVTGDVNIVGSLTFNNLNDTIKVQGNWSNSGSLNHSGNGAVVIFGSDEQSIDPNGTGTGKTFSRLSIEKDAGTASLAGALKVDRSIALINGTLDVSNYDITVAGSWMKTDTATFSYQNRTVTFTQADSVIYGSGTNDFNNVVIQANTDLGGSLDINGNLTISNANLDISSNNYGISVQRDWINNGGSFTARTGNVILDGDQQDIEGTAVTTFNNLTVESTNNTELLQNVNVNGTFSLNNRYLYLRSYTLDGTGASNLFVMSSGTQLYVQDNNFPTNFEGFAIDQASYVRYNYAGAQDVVGQDASGSQIGYGYLYLEGSGTKTAQHNLDVNASLYIANNVGFDLNSKDISVELYWDNNQGGTFANTGGAGTVTMDREGTQYVYSNTTTGDAFPSLVFAGSGAKVLSGNISVAGNLTMNTGISYLNLQNYTVTGSGAGNELNLSSNVTLYVRGANNFPSGFEVINFAQNSIVRYDANMAQTVVTHDANGDQIQYGDIYFRYNTKILSGHLDVRGLFYNYASTTIDATGNNYNINIGRNYVNIGSINFNSNTVTFDGGDEQIMYSYGTGSGKAFNHLRINKSSDSYLRIYTYDVQVDSNVVFDGGILANHNRTVTVNGNWTATGSATMDSRSGNITFSGNRQRTITTGGSNDFYDVNFNGSDTTFLGSNLDVMHDLSIGSTETLDVTLNNYTISIQGDYTNSNVIVPQNGVLEFNGTGTQEIYTGGNGAGEALYDLKINKSSGYAYLRENMLLNGSAYFEGPGSTSVRFYFDDNDVEVKGSWFNPEAIYVISGTETITFSGTTKDTIQAGYSSALTSRFGNLVIDHQDSVIHIGDIRVDLGYTINRGEVYLNGNSFYFSNTYNSDKEFKLTTGAGVSKFDVGTGGELLVRGGNHVIIESASADTSVFRVVGETTNISEITNWGGRYSFTVNGGGRIYAKNYRFSYLDTSGVRIDGGAIAGVGADTTEDFSNGSFALGQSGGRYLYIVDNDQTLQIDSVNFINSLGGSGINVEKVDAEGRITFYNATGEYAGQAYEQDPNNRIDWVTVFTGITWTGNNSKNWHDGGNWSLGAVPTATDQVTIPNVTNDPLISSNDAVCASMVIEANASLEIGGNKDLTINGGIENNGSITIFGNDTVYVSGDYVNSGTLNAGTGTFVLNGIIQKFNTGGTGNNRAFYNVLISGGASVLLENNLRVTNDITIDAGASLDVGANRAINVEGDWANSGTLVYGNGLVTFNGASAQTITGSGTDDFYNITFSNSGAKTLAGTIDVQGQFRINSGASVNGGAGTLKCNASFYNFGSFNGQNGTVNFDGTGTSYIYGDVNPVFHNLIFSNGGNRVLETNINVDSLLLVESGVNYLNLQTYTVNATNSNDSLHLASGSRLYVRGADNFPSDFSAINLEAGSYVRYDADLTQNVSTKDADGESFTYGFLELYHTTDGSRKILDGDLTTTDEIQINDLDTLDVTVNNYNITCGGRFDQYGYILANGAAVQNTLTMNGQGNHYFTPAGSGLGKELYNIVVNVGAGNSMIFAGSEALVCNSFTINSGQVNPNGNRDITIGGSLVVNSGELLGSGSHIYFVGSGDITFKPNGSTLNRVTLDGSGKTMTLGDNLNMNGNLTIGSGDTLTLSGNTFNFGNGSDALTVNGVLDVDAGSKLLMANTSSMLVGSSGQLNVVGVSGNIAQVSRITGTYAIEVQGTIAAKHYLFEYLNQQGLYINGGTIDTDNNFSYGTFTNGATNGKFLFINNNSQTLTGANKIVEVQFPSQPGGTSYNMFVTNSASGSYNIEDATGTFEGAAFEYDPDAVVDWTYTAVTRYWTGLTNTDWHNPNNWSPKATPDNNDNVVITSKSNLPIIDTADAVCKNLELTGGSLLLRNGNNLEVAGNIVIGSGTSFTVNSSADTVKLGGNWSNSGTYTHGNSALIFQGLNSQNLISGGTSIGKRLYCLQIDKNATANVNLSGNDLYLENDLQLVSGRLDAGSRDISVKGDWRNTGGEFVSSTGQVIFVGNENDTITTNGDSFYDLTLNVGTGSITADDNIRVENDFIINTGAFYVNSKTVSVGSGSGDKLSIQGRLVLDENSTVELKGGSNGLLVESGGVLQALGTSSSSLAQFTRYGSSGYYPIIMNSGGQISAQYTKFSYTNGSGVWVKLGASINTTNKLHNCVFENGSESSYLRISNTQVLGTITGVTFSSVGSTPSNNVLYDGFGSVLFDNYSGGFSGSRYENDNGSDPVGNARWTFTETQSVSAGNTYTFGNDFEITVNTVGSPALNQITVQLLDEQYNSLSQTYNRYYVITTNAGASGYTTAMKLYYADGSSGSNNEVPEGGSDSDPKVWYKQSDLIPGILFEDGNNTTQNWVLANTSGEINGNWFISDQSDESALPVELVAYNLENKDNAVSINWTTATEIDNLGFILERSTEPDEGFKQIASYLSTNALKGQGTISAETNYNYVDYHKFLAGQTYYYRLSDVDISGKRNVLETKLITRPEAYSLHQNYPNPFNPTTTIQFSLEKAGKTVLEVYDILGRKVTTLVNQQMKAGAHIINWNARNYASGVYFYRLQSGDFARVKKMMLVK